MASVLSRLRSALPTTTKRDSAYWLVRFTKPILFFTLIFAIAGVYMATRVPIAVFPETNFPRIIIGVDNGVMPVEQMQVLITKPIEDAVNSVPGLVSVRSITSRGSAEINLFFDWHTDILQTLTLVNGALGQIQHQLPPSVSITVNRLTFASFPILGYSLTSNSQPLTRLWEIATYDLKPPLNRVEGVSTVNVQGGEEPEFHIVPDPAKLVQTGVTVSDLLEAVRRTNLVDSPGLYEANHQLILGLVGGQVHSAEELAQVSVKTTQAGIPVRIGDVAQVGSGVRPLYTVVSADGQPAVLLNITRQPASNTVTVTDAVGAKLAGLKKTLPPGVTVKPFYDQSQLVRDSIASVRDAILIGLVLASVILVVFLQDWGSSVVAGLVIPVTVLITFVFLKLLGQSFDLMTLGGLAAAVGLVIDDAIVVVENIVLHRDSGEPRVSAIRKALKEITPPLIGSTVTPIVVFLPLITVVGVTGVFFRALALTMTIALATSLMLALTWTPSLSYFLVRRSAHEPTLADEELSQGDELRRLIAAEESSERGWLKRVLDGYGRVLQTALMRPAWVVSACLLLVAAAFFSYRALGSDLLPAMDEGGFILDYLSPAGSSLTDTNRMVLQVEHILRDTPEVESTSRRTGLQLGLSAVTEANRGDISVKLKRNRHRDIDDIMADVRSRVKQQVPALDVEFLQVLQDMIGDLSNAPEPVQIKLYSNNADELAKWGPAVADAIGKHKGVVDVLNGIENTISGPATQFQVDTAAAARSGFSAEELATDAAAIVEGEPAVTPMVSNGRPYTVRVRFPAANRASLEAIQNTLLGSASGHTATLGSLAQVTQLGGQNEIRRENLQRDVVVTARLEGTDLGSAIDKIKNTVAGLHIPPSVRVEYGGQYEEQQQSFHELLIVLCLAMALVFGVLLIEFRSFSAPIAILISSVLSSAGVFFALLVTGITFNVASFMGVIMVIGIVAKNGILLLDADQKFRSIGMSAREAMIQAGRRRLRPILMTALAAATGMLPLAFGLGAGSQMLQPLAIAVIGGITVSMALSLIVTPLAYYGMSRLAS